MNATSLYQAKKAIRANAPSMMTRNTNGELESAKPSIKVTPGPNAQQQRLNGFVDRLKSYKYEHLKNYYMAINYMP